MRSQLIISTALLLIAGLIWWAAWAIGRAAGLALGVVVSSPIIAQALAPLVVSLLGRSVQVAREIAYRDIQGCYFEYKGKSVQVHEDFVGERWLRAADIRKVAPDFPRATLIKSTAGADPALSRA